MYQRGSDGPTVRFIQSWLNVVLMQRRAEALLQCDGKFGPKTEKTVKRLQYWEGLQQDGVVGPLTWRRLCRVMAYKQKGFAVNLWGYFHPQCGPLPTNGLLPVGKCSTFGGPDDKWDRCYGQKWLPGKSEIDPSQIPSEFPKMAMDMVFRPEVFSLNEYPMTTDEKGRARRAGLSWALNPESFFCALRMPRAFMAGHYGDNVPKIAARNPNNPAAPMVVMYLTDYGPAEAFTGGRMIDISDGSARALMVGNNDHLEIFWAGDHDAVGIYPRISTKAA